MQNHASLKQANQYLSLALSREHCRAIPMIVGEYKFLTSGHVAGHDALLAKPKLSASQLGS